MNLSTVKWASETKPNPRNHASDGGPYPTRQRAILRRKSGWSRTCTVVDILKVTQRGAECVRCRCRLGCTRWDAHGCHLVNTTELFMCNGNAALHQITLTSCY